MTRRVLEVVGHALVVEAGAREPLDAGRATEIGQHLRERMCAVEISVAIRRYDQHPQRRRGAQDVA